MPVPSVPEPFYWTNEAWGPALRCRALDPIAPHLFTSRALQLSSAEGRMAAAHAIGAAEAVMVTQVHGNGVVVVRRGEARPSAATAADVLVSDDPQVAVAVRAADCVPLLLGDRRTGAVAAVHAGWRGMLAGIVPATVAEVAARSGTAPANLRVALGPSIDGCCFEIEREIAARFAERFGDGVWQAWRDGGSGRAPGKGTLDLRRVGRRILLDAGVPDEAIEFVGPCTFCGDSGFASYRRDGANAGRQSSWIGIET